MKTKEIVQKKLEFILDLNSKKNLTPLPELMSDIHSTAKQKGWWDNGERNTGELLMLIVSELSEAMEADRKGSVSGYEEFIKEYNSSDDRVSWVELFEKHIRGTLEEEMADATIRIFDMCEKMLPDFAMVMMLKMEYNKLRPYRHGGKKY